VEVHRLDARIRHDVRHFGRVVHTYRLLRGLGYQLTPSDELRLGRALYEAGSPEGGRAVLERLLAQPEPQPAAVIEFVRREGKQRFEVAHAALVAALARVPGDPDLLEALVDLERAAGRSADSLARLDAEIAAGRARPRVLLLRARVLTAQGELARAEADVLRAFEAAPLLPGAVELLFDIYRRQDRLDEARRSFEAAETAGVLHAGARMLLGRLYRSQGDLARAQQAYEGVVAELPQLGAAKSGLALVLAERGEQLDRAIELAHEAKRQAPLWDPAAMDALAYVYYRAGRLKEALDEQGRAILSAKTASGVVAPLYSYHLGLVLQAMGRASEAASAFERALDGGEDFPEAADARRRLEAEVATPAPDAKAS
jgi:tetratricopeptide (TPR) repeat protein